MTDAPTPLILDFLEWVAAGPRRYAEAMDVWRTSCPRLTVWEDAVDGGLVATARRGAELWVSVTVAGRAALAAGGRASPADVDAAAGGAAAAKAACAELADIAE